MGNTQGGYGAAVQKLEGHFAEWTAEEDRLTLALKQLIQSGGDPKKERGKELAHELARVTGRIRGLIVGLDNESKKLQEEEKRLLQTIQAAGQQATAGVNEQLATQLVQARKNRQDFEIAVTNLRTSLQDWKVSNTNQKLLLHGTDPSFFESFRKAIQHDKNRDYEAALSLYQEGISQATQAMTKFNNNNNDKRKPLIKERVQVYSKRVQELQNFLQTRKLAAATTTAGRQQQQQQQQQQPQMMMMQPPMQQGQQQPPPQMQGQMGGQQPSQQMQMQMQQQQQQQQMMMMQQQQAMQGQPQMVMQQQPMQGQNLPQIGQAQQPAPQGNPFDVY